MGISEIRRVGENIKMQEGNIFCYTGNNDGRGFRFCIDEKLKPFTRCKGITDRMTLAKFKFKRNKTLTLNRIYASTIASEEKECDKFYEDLSDALNDRKINKKSLVIIMEDFNR